jgi:hypothetical protein
MGRSLIRSRWPARGCGGGGIAYTPNRNVDLRGVSGGERRLRTRLIAEQEYSFERQPNSVARI